MSGSAPKEGEGGGGRGGGTRKLLESNKASDPVSLLLRVVLHELLVSDRAVIRVANVRAVAAPGQQ
jgi:hypothetical protein